MKPEIKKTDPISHDFFNREEDSFSTNDQIDIKPTFQSFSVGKLTTSKEINSSPVLSDRDVKPQTSGSSQSDQLTTIPLNSYNIKHLSFINDSANAHITPEAVNSSVIKEELKNLNASAEIIGKRKRKTVQEERWSLFINELKKMPVSEASIERVNSVRKRAIHIEEIIFFVDLYGNTDGYGDFNLCVEFLRNFMKIASENLKLVRFVSEDPSDEGKIFHLSFQNMLVPLIAGMSPAEKYPKKKHRRS
ncbi:MAG: hypothetical protein KAG53_05360 [Endozoicomonadaceae bacterium]|nr:hypothetical protein [Endozoicomonadaceae bacterium]